MIVALAIYIITAIILQLWLGCIEVSIFAFPVNIAIAIATIMALWVAEKEYSSLLAAAYRRTHRATGWPELLD